MFVCSVEKAMRHNPLYICKFYTRHSCRLIHDSRKQVTPEKILIHYGILSERPAEWQVRICLTAVTKQRDVAGDGESYPVTSWRTAGASYHSIKTHWNPAPRLDM
jgi:hypothetical protein